jgi:hypothetical protein
MVRPANEEARCPNASDDETATLHSLILRREMSLSKECLNSFRFGQSPAGGTASMPDAAAQVTPPRCYVRGIVESASAPAAFPSSPRRAMTAA